MTTGLATGTEHPLPLAELEGHSYCLLTTFRRSGEAVGTPVWFAVAAGTIYVKTGVDSGKVKRLRAHAAVQVAPCTLRGRPRGPTVDAVGRVVTDPNEETLAEQALAAKYGVGRPLILAFLHWRGVEELYLAIEPPRSEGGEQGGE
jgi:PPOX class probable F420-dependent enzyme